MKNSRSLRSSILALSLGLLGFAAARASAQTVINSAPYFINAPGHYVLGGNLNSTAVYGPAIKITAPNVILDLNRHYIAAPGNTAGGNNVGESVILVGDVANVTIRNGTLAGAAYGIYFSSASVATSRNYVVRNVTVTRCYLTGISFDYAAPGSLVKNCGFSAIGNSTQSANVTATAIFSKGGVRIEGNNIGDVTSTGTGISRGIVSGGSSGDFIVGNTVANCKFGIYGGKYLNNLTSNVTTPFSGGVNATGNN